MAVDRRTVSAMRFGVIGLGAIGARHARCIAGAPGGLVTLGAVACADEDNAHRLGAELCVPHFHSAQELLDSGLCDAVIIAVPHYLHPPLIIRAARAGLHVLSEKPLGVTVGPARAAAAECRARGVSLGVMFQLRLRCSVLRLRQMIDDGVFGDIQRVDMTCSTWTRTQAYYAASPWRGTWAGEGGGVLMNQAPHSLDLFLWLGGMPRTVLASLSTRTHHIEVENTAELICGYDGGQTGHVYVTTAEAPGEDRLVVAGDRATAVLAGGRLRLGRLPHGLCNHLLTSPLSGSEDGKLAADWQDVPCEPDRPDLEMSLSVIERFARHVREGAPLVANGEDGLRQVELTNAAYLSDAESRPVALPVDAAAAEDLLTSRCGRLAPPDSLRGQAAAELATLQGGTMRIRSADCANWKQVR